MNETKYGNYTNEKFLNYGTYRYRYECLTPGLLASIIRTLQCLVTRHAKVYPSHGGIKF